MNASKGAHTILGVEEALSPRDGFLLLLKLFLFHLRLFPVLVGNFCEHSPVSLRSLIFVILKFLLMLLYFLLNDLLSLLDQGGLEPLLELHVALLLPLLLLEALALLLLDIYQLLVLDVHLLAVLPLIHGVGSFLHSDGRLLLLLEERLQQVSLGLSDKCGA